MPAVAIAGGAAISRHGPSWRGLARALAGRTSLPGIPPETPLANPKARNVRKMMSRGAYLSAAALGELVRELGWSLAEREAAGYYLGVGASGGSLDDVTALLEASIVGDDPDKAFSTTAFGDRGLAACNPLLAFQLMNNFTLAHGAILEGLGGPNGALFSRGSGTTAALGEAVHAIACGDCDRAIAGGADSAIHPVTLAELAREGFTAQGLDAAEGAALLGLVRADLAGAAPIVVAGCVVASGRGRALLDTITEAADRALAGGGCDAIVIAGWGPPARDAIAGWAHARFPSVWLLDTAALGATLAAGPALGWVTALDLLTDRARADVHAAMLDRILIIDAGVDGDAGAVVLARTRAEVG